MIYESGWVRLDGDPSGPLRRCVIEAMGDEKKIDIARRMGVDDRQYWSYYSRILRERKRLNETISRWMGDGLGYKRWKITIEVE